MAEPVISSFDDIPRHMGVVYALEDPRDGSLYYVGSSTNPKVRWRDYMRRRSHGNSQLGDRLTGIRASGNRIHMVVLECVDSRGTGMVLLRHGEREWIRRLLEQGHPLCNQHSLPGRRCAHV